MNKKISTLLASALLVGSVGAFAQTATFKDGATIFIKNAATNANTTHLNSTYLKVTPDLKGIVPVLQSKYALDTKAEIDSISWKVEERINAEGKKDYAFVSVLNKDLTLSFAAATKVFEAASDEYVNAFNTTDSAKVVANKTYWAINATRPATAGYLAYQYNVAGKDSVMALGVFNITNNDVGAEHKNHLMLRVAKAKLDRTILTTVNAFEAADTWCSDYTSWTFDAQAVVDALNAVKNMTYADLKLPVIQSTNIPGLANFQVVPVKSYSNGDITFYDASENADEATKFVFLPASQIGAKKPEYFTIDTLRYRLESVHQDAQFGYGLDTDTLITKADTKVRNGLKVFSMSYLVGNPDSVTFTPAAYVEYQSAAPYFKITENTDDKTVLGAAVLEDKVLVSTVVKDSRKRKEGTLMPYAFEAPVYPNIPEGYYFFQSTNKATADKYITLSLCGEKPNDYKVFADEVSADNSYQVWVVSGKGKDMKIQNRYTGEDFSLILFEAGEGLYTTGKLDTFKIEAINDIKKGGVDYYQIEAPEYKKFAFSLINNIGQNIYVTPVTDSILGVKAQEEATLFFVPTAGAATKYGVNNELVATPYTFATKDGLKLGYNAQGRLVISKNVTTVAEFYFKAAAEGGYYIVDAALTENAIATQATKEVKYLEVFPTDNYLTTIALKGCPTGMDRFELATPAAPKYLTVAPGHYMIKTDGREDMLTMGTDNAAIFRRITSDLKSGYNKESFALWIDTAKYDAGETPLNVPTYFIMKGASYNEDTLAGNFLGASREDSVLFVNAKRIATKDNLVITSTGKAVKKTDAAAYQFKFPFVEGESGAVYVQNEKNQYLRIINEYVTYIDAKERDKAIAVNVVPTDAPTANEDVTVSEVTVIAGEGNVTVAGAAGKKVVVSNILGQVVANTVLSSDNATIAAPQGVVVVAVEGEEAVKAIVK